MKKRRLDRYIQRIENLLRLSLRGGESEVAWKAIRSLQFAGNQMIFKRATSWVRLRTAFPQDARR